VYFHISWGAAAETLALLAVANNVNRPMRRKALQGLAMPGDRLTPARTGEIGSTPGEKRGQTWGALANA
jgi:hypothetical protein